MLFRENFSTRSTSLPLSHGPLLSLEKYFNGFEVENRQDEASLLEDPIRFRLFCKNGETFTGLLVPKTPLGARQRKISARWFRLSE